LAIYLEDGEGGASSGLGAGAGGDGSGGFLGSADKFAEREAEMAKQRKMGGGGARKRVYCGLRRKS